MASKRLADEIKHFQKQKRVIVPVLLALGVVGLFLPLLPGLALLFLAVLLIFPRGGESLLQKLRGLFKNVL